MYEHISRNTIQCTRAYVGAHATSRKLEVFDSRAHSMWKPIDKTTKWDTSEHKASRGSDSAAQRHYWAMPSGAHAKTQKQRECDFQAHNMWKSIDKTTKWDASKREAWRGSDSTAQRHQWAMADGAHATTQKRRACDFHAHSMWKSIDKTTKWDTCEREAWRGHDSAAQRHHWAMSDGAHVITQKRRACDFHAHSMS